MNETECPRLCSEHRALLIESDAQNVDETLAGCLSPKIHKGKQAGSPQCQG